MQIQRIFLVFTTFLTLFCSAAQAAEPLTIHTPSHDYAYQIDIAKTSAEQEKGLMFRESLPQDTGMLFPQAEDHDIKMWMKNTPLSLDMLFIDKRGTIVYIARNCVPDSTAIISSGLPVRAVLEVAGGDTAKKHIDVGDHIIHKLFPP